MRLKSFVPAVAALTAFSLLLLIQDVRGQQHGLVLSPAQPLSRDRDLLSACSRGDVQAVRRLLVQGADPNARGEKKVTPLIIAAAKGQPELTRLLLQRSADAGARCEVPHETNALEAALYHRQNDVERVNAVPNDPGGESMRNLPMGDEAVILDNQYAEVIRTLRLQTARKKTVAKKDNLD